MGISLSFSAAQKYLLSPAAWFYHYVRRLRPSDRGSALFFGAAVDEGINVLLTDKMNGKEPRLLQAMTTFIDHFSKQRFNGEDLVLWKPGVVKFSKADYDSSLILESDNQMDEGKDPSWCSLRNKGLIILEEFYNQVLPKLEKVLAVQLEINVENSTGDRFTGKTDFIAVIGGKTWLVDNKTTSVTYKENSASESGQLATYFDQLKEKYKLDGVMYITISKTILKKKIPRVNIKFIEGYVSEEVIAKTYGEFDEVLEGIKNEVFDCSGQCRNRRINPFGCCYAKYCESGDMDGLVDLGPVKERK